jgi:hypothetical protein
MKTRAGSRNYKGYEVPINAKIESDNGKEFYVCGAFIDGSTAFEKIKFIETNKIEKRVKK